MDLPGNGKSSHYPDGIGYNYLDSMQFIRRVAEALGLSKFGLIGHSMGGGMASIYAGTFPEQVSQNSTTVSP